MKEEKIKKKSMTVNSTIDVHTSVKLEDVADFTKSRDSFYDKLIWNFDPTEKEIKGYHTYIKILDEEYIIPYGKSKFLQFFYIYNPYLYFKSCYKWKSHIALCKYNCNWIAMIDFYCKFKKNRDINQRDARDQKKKVKIKLF